MDSRCEIWSSSKENRGHHEGHSSWDPCVGGIKAWRVVYGRLRGGESNGVACGRQWLPNGDRYDFQVPANHREKQGKEKQKEQKRGKETSFPPRAQTEGPYLRREILFFLWERGKRWFFELLLFLQMTEKWYLVWCFAKSYSILLLHTMWSISFGIFQNFQFIEVCARARFS